MTPGQPGIELVYPNAVKFIFGSVGLVMTVIGASLLTETLATCCISWNQMVLACVIVGFILRFGVAFLLEPSKHIIFRGSDLTVLWIGGLYTQKYMLNREMTLVSEHIENSRYNVSKRLRLRQRHLKCVIPSVMGGFELLCSNLREDLQIRAPSHLISFPVTSTLTVSLNSS